MTLDPPLSTVFPYTTLFRSPDVRISRIGLSDWLHHNAHESHPLASTVRRHSRSPSSRCDNSWLGPLVNAAAVSLSSITAPSIFPQRTRSKGPFLRRHYSTSA